MNKPYIAKNLSRLVFLLLLFVSGIIKAQNTVSIGTDELKSNAVLWLNGDGSQGLLLPTVSNVSNVSNPDAGMVVFQTVSNTVSYFNGTSWINVGAGGGGGTTYGLAYANGQISLVEGGTTSGVTIALLGDVAGDANAVTVTAIQGRNVASTAPADTEVLAWNNANNQWEPTTISAATGDNWGSQVVVTDGTLSGTGVTGDPLSVASVDDADADPTNELQDAIEVPVSPSGNLTSTNVQGALEELQADLDASGGTDDQVANEVPVIPQNGITSTETQAALEELQGEITTNVSNITTNATDITNNAAAIAADTDGDATNELQDLSLAGTTINIAGGTGVDLAPIIPPGGTDDQVANEVPVSPSGNLTSTNVQGALEELQADLDASGGTDDQVANEVPVTPQNGITSTETQAALEELQGEITANQTNITSNTTAIAADTDGDATNELQDLSLAGTTINIAGGTGVDLAPIIPAGGTDDQVANEVPVTPQNGITSTETQAALEELQGEITANQTNITSNTTALAADTDGDATNELQDLGLSGATGSAAAGEVFNLDVTSGTGVTLTEGTNIEIQRSGNNLTIGSTAAASGEANDGINVGSAGVGPYKQKSGANLEFKNINTSSSAITVSDDVGNDEIDIGLDQSAINIPLTQVTGDGTIATQDANAVNITGGTLDNVSITNGTFFGNGSGLTGITSTVNTVVSKITGDGSAGTPLTIATDAITESELANNAVTSAEIDDGTIVNADISNGAAVDVSKLAAGTDGDILQVVGGIPTWSAAGSSNDAQSLQGTDIDPAISGATDGQILKWNDANSRWELSSDDVGGGGAPTLSDGQIITGNGASNTASGVSGDLTMSGAADFQIATDAVTTTEIADGTITGTDISPSTDIIANSFSGDGSGLTGVTATVVTDGSTVQGNGSGGSPITVPNGGITSTQLAAGAVSGGAGGVITDNSITGADISTSADITANSFTGDGSGLTGITSTVQSDGATVLGDGSGGDQLRVGQIGSTEITDGSVTSTDIANGTITNADIAAGAAIDATKIAGLVDNDATNEIQDFSEVLSQGNSAGTAAIIDLADPTNPQDAATKAYVDANAGTDSQDIANVLGQGNNTGGATITGLPAPVAASDVATKDYIDNLAASNNIAGTFASGFTLETDAVFSGNIADGEVQTTDIASGGNDQVLTTDGTGVVQWEPKSNLGGSLQSAYDGGSIIDLDGSNELTINTSAASPLLVTDDANGRIGVGTATPAETLDVVSTGTAIVGTTNSNNSGDFAISGIHDGTGDVAGFFWARNAVGGANSHGVYGQADGQGVGVFGVNNGTTGVAGRFWNFQAGNPNPVLEIFNTGSGVGLYTDTRIQIQDGTEAAGRVLTSDVDGIATWQDAPGGGSLQGAYDGGSSIQLDGTNEFVLSNSVGNPILATDDVNSFIGVGTPLPISKFQVGAGNIQIDGEQSLLAFDPTDVFSFGLSTSIPQYSLGWYEDPDNGGGLAAAYLSGFAGIKMFTNGTPRITIEQFGNVGIGTTGLPPNKLTVQPSASGDGVRITSDGSGNKGTLILNDADDTQAVFIAGADDMLANYTLTLPADAGSNGQVLATDGSGNLSWSSAGTAPTLQNAYDGGNTINLSAAGNLFINNNTSSETLFSIDELTGNIGLGIGTAQRQLQLNRPGSVTSIAQFTNSTSGDTFTDGLIVGITNANATFRNFEAGNMLFNTNGADRMIIAGNGRVGIGTLSPTNALHVSGGSIDIDLGEFYEIGDENVLGYNGSSVQIGSNLTVPLAFWAGSEAGRFDTDGDFGVGTTNPVHPVDVVGDINTSTFYRINSVDVLKRLGDESIQLGEGAGVNVSSGVGNLMAGYRAGAGLTDATDNVFLGRVAGFNENGDQNVYVGSGAGLSSGDAVGNVGVGYNALNNANGGDGNLGIGFTAGEAITTGRTNTLIGTQADVGVGSINDAVAIGWRSIAGADGSVAIGVNSNSTVTNSIRLGQDGSPVEFNGPLNPAGPGTQGTSGQVLTSNGAGNAPTWQAAASSPWTGSPDISYVGGNVGIGTSSPSRLLQINSNTASSTSSQVIVSDQSGTGDASMTFTSQGGNTFTMGVDASDADKFKISDATSVGSGDRMTIDNFGHVGFGISQPNLNMQLHDGSSSTTLQITSATQSANNDGLWIQQSSVQDAAILNREAGDLSFGTSAATRMLIDPAGNVGIGTTSPTRKFHVNDNTASQYAAYIQQGTSTGNGLQVYVNTVSASQNVLQAGSNTAGLTVKGDGDVGVGTTAPSAKLDVVGDVETTGDYTYSSARTKYASYAPTIFNSILPDSYGFGTLNAATLYGRFSSGGGTFAYATASVNLPDGAVVTSLTGWIYDNDSGHPVRVDLRRQTLGSSSSSTMAQIESSSANASTAVQNLSDNTISFSTIDNQNNSYFLFFTGRQNSTNTRLYGVRITYTVTQAD